MNPFAVVEEACASFVERTFARVFPGGGVSPAQIARKLVATMQSAPADGYLVRLHPRDAARLGPERVALEREWSAVLQRTARTLQLDVARAPRVIIQADEHTVSGTVTIEAAVRDEEQAVLRGYALRIARGLPLDRRVRIEDAVLVGRGPENELDVTDVRVSRRHARVQLGSEGPEIQDLGSTNGTSVNGRRITAPQRLALGDRIGVGDTELVVELPDD